MLYNPSLTSQKHAKAPIERAWQNFTSNRLAMLGFLGVIFLCCISMAAPLFFHVLYEVQSEFLLVPPVWHPEGSFSFLLGTDDLGRNILHRLLQGTRLTFGNAMLIALLSMCIGASIGVLSAINQGFLSNMFLHILDIFLALPSLLLAIIGVAILGPTLENAFIAITLALTPQFVKTIHKEVYQEISKEYISALRLDGASKGYILFNTVLPNILEAVLIQFTRALSAAILDISAIGFLGLGSQPSSSEWGTMLADAADLAYLAPWTVTLPGLAIMFSVLCVNLAGEGLRQAIHESHR